MLILNIVLYFGIYLDLWLFERNRFVVSKAKKNESKAKPNGESDPGS